MSTTLLSLNVRNGGGARVDAIVDHITSHRPDVVALSEVRAGTADAWHRALAARGFHCFSWCAPPSDQPDAILIGSRELFETENDDPPFICRSRSVVFPASGITLIVAHFWTSKTKIAPGGKRAMWAWLRSRLGQAQENWLLMGDLNTGDARDRHSGWRKSFGGESDFEHLTRHAGVDLWRLHHGNLVEWSWIHTRNVKARREAGFRIDHAIASPDVARACVRCRYDHDFRAFDHARNRFPLTDHSAIIVEFSDAKARANRERPTCALRSIPEAPPLPFPR